MTTPAIEALLARLFRDETLRTEFVADPRAVSLRFGLTESEAGAMENIDRLGLELASKSIERKNLRRGQCGGGH